MTDRQAYGWKPWTTPEEAWAVAVSNRGLIFKSFEGLRGKIPASVTFDELFSWAWEGLYKAVVGFNPALGFQFSTYAVVAIRRAIVHGIKTELRGLTDFDGTRRSWPARNPMAIVGVSRDGDGEYEREVIALEDFSPDVDQFLDDVVAIHAVRDLADPDDLELLRRYYIEGNSLYALAREEGVSHEAIRLRRDKALRRVREALEQASGPVDERPSSSAASGAGPLHTKAEGER